ncbi:uncharacterized protein LOC126743767 [Anthonomus grandis grandis]|uniref:uncharacterized protein LOC126743767 n=1 Tax=Anthonomus grandis grandis TaxID=2921223 RepID=UPI00216674A4|nr:uncharacterized protein LOC126743767 [Anthonomus grandis grandis]
MIIKSVLALLCLITVVKGDLGVIENNIWDEILESLVQIAVRSIEKVLTETGNITLVNEPTTVNVTVATIVAGTLYCDDATFFGLESLSLPVEFKSDLSNSNISFSLTPTVSDGIGFDVQNYTADVGIANQIPLYGTNGATSLAMNKLKLKIGANVSWNKTGIFLENLQLKPFFLAKVKFTQIFNNPDFSSTVSNALSLLVDAGLVLYYIEEKCITCALSSVVQSAINGNLTDFWKNLVNDCMSICLHSQSTLVNAAFQSDPTNFNEEDLKNFVVSALEELVVFLEGRLEI